jgi:hypothetical protein
MMLAVLLASPAAAARHLAGVNMIGKGGSAAKYQVAAPAVAGAFYQTRTFFAPAAPVPVQYVQQAPVVAAAPTVIQTAPIAQQPLVVAAQPTVVAAQPTLVAAAPALVAAAPKKDVGIEMNIGVKLNKSLQGNLWELIGKPRG